MRNEQVAEHFGKGNTSGHSNNMFIEGDTIYSYGYHFPIAKRYENKYLFNTLGYSNTTVRHKYYVLRNIAKDTIIYIENCRLFNASKQILINNEEIDNLKQKITRARKEHIKQGYKDKIEWLNNQNEQLEQIKKTFKQK